MLWHLTDGGDLLCLEPFHLDWEIERLGHVPQTKLEGPMASAGSSGAWGIFSQSSKWTLSAGLRSDQGGGEWGSDAVNLETALRLGASCPPQDAACAGWVLMMEPGSPAPQDPITASSGPLPQSHPPRSYGHSRDDVLLRKVHREEPEGTLSLSIVQGGFSHEVQ